MSEPTDCLLTPTQVAAEAKRIMHANRRALRASLAVWARAHPNAADPVMCLAPQGDDPGFGKIVPRREMIELLRASPSAPLQWFVDVLAHMPLVPRGAIDVFVLVPGGVAVARLEPAPEGAG